MRSRGEEERRSGGKDDMRGGEEGRRGGVKERMRGRGGWD